MLSGAIAAGSPLAAAATRRSLLFAVRLRVDDPELLPELIRFLEARLDMVTVRRGANELEWSLLGSYGQEEGRETLALVVQAWQEADPVRRGSVRFVE